MTIRQAASGARTAAATACRAVATGSRWLQEGLAEAERVARFARGSMEFRPRPDDLWVVTYPRSGTTWSTYLLHLLLGRGSSFEHIEDVCPWFERSLAVGTRTARDFEDLASPRVFKTHLLPQWTPKAGRFLYVRRNPVDVARSYHALYRDYLGYPGSLPEFTERMLAGDVQYGSWLSHVEAWSRAGVRSIYTIRYEDLRAEPETTLAALGEYFEIPCDAMAISEALKAASLANMRVAQAKFDHATSLLRERGVRPGSFIRGDAGDPLHTDTDIAPLIFAARAAPRPKTPLRAFLR